MTAPVYAWIVLALTVIGIPTGYDVWAHAAHRETMSGKAHDWLMTAWGGPIIVGLLAAIPVALAWHFIVYHRRV